MTNDPLSRWLAGVRPEDLSGVLKEIGLETSRTREELLPLLYLGLLDRLVDGVGSATASSPGLDNAVRRLRSSEGPLRFQVYEHRTKLEGLERVARFAGREVALTENWMIPNLEADIALYRARIRALEAKRATGEHPT